MITHSLERLVNRITGRSYPYPRFINRLHDFATIRGYGNVSAAQPSIDIVMLTFNRLADTKRTIASIYRETKLPFTLHLVDANSSDGTREYIRELAREKSNVDLVLLPKNLGVSGGRAKALETCSSEFVAYIDNDMVIMPGYFENLVESLKSDPQIAGVQAKVVYPGGKIQINHPDFSEDDSIINFYDLDSGKVYDDPSTLTQLDCKWIPMGATIWRKQVLSEIKIDAEMLGSYEDNDFSYRVHQSGYKLRNCPASLVVHISAEYTPQVMSDTQYTGGRFNQDKTRNAAKRFYTKTHKLFVFGDDADKFVQTIGFDSFADYKAYILAS